MLDKGKTNALILTAVCVALIGGLVYVLFFNTHALITLDDPSSIVSSSAYLDMTAVVTADGNCYIRGSRVEKSHPYGVANVRQYRNQYNTLALEQADRFVQIYSGGDAIAVNLSKNGGTIITANNKLYLFSDTDSFLRPSYFCENIQDAKLVGDRVYVLTTDGVWGYYTISSQKNFVAITDRITKFKIADLDKSLWLLTKDRVLLTCENVDNPQNTIRCADNVDDFDVICVEARMQPHYLLGYIRNNEAFCYDGYGFPTETDLDALKMVNANAISISAYLKGIIVVTPERQALVYGKDFGDDATFHGNTIAENVINISTSLLSVNLALESKEMICCGSLPSSQFISIQDIIRQ